MDEVHVVQPGMLTTVQDLGRWGFQSRGVTVSGPMDVFSHRRANALVGNPKGAATLEVTLTGPELEFTREGFVSVSGAEFVIELDGHPASMNQALRVVRGTRLTLGRRVTGARAYVAVQGGIDVPLVLGSRATSPAARLGGLDGRPLRAGDRLPIGRFDPRHQKPGRKPVALQNIPDGRARLRFLPGPQADRFGDDELVTLCGNRFVVDPRSDRMGFRLGGPRLGRASGPDMISDATPMGSIQVPASGQPILLMADRQTTGGYPKIGVVISADLGLAGQLAPGDAITFVPCTRREALTALIAEERELLAIEQDDAA